MRFRAALLLLSSLVILNAHAASNPAPAADSLGRDNPRSSVIGFLHACQRQDYNDASQYLDLRNLSDKARQDKGPEIARKLEAALNSSPQFNALKLTQDPDGSSDSTAQPPRETVTTLTQNGETYT